MQRGPGSRSNAKSADCLRTKNSGPPASKLLNSRMFPRRIFAEKFPAFFPYYQGILPMSELLRGSAHAAAFSR